MHVQHISRERENVVAISMAIVVEADAWDRKNFIWHKISTKSIIISSNNNNNKNKKTIDMEL